MGIGHTRKQKASANKEVQKGQDLTLSPQHCFECLEGGVSPVGSRALRLVLARICRRASWIESNLPSTLDSKFAWRVSIFSNLSSSRWMRASSGLAGSAEGTDGVVQGFEGSLGVDLPLPFWLPFPLALPLRGGPCSTSWMSISTTSALICSGKEVTVGFLSVVTIHTCTPAARYVRRGSTGSFNA